MRFKNNVGPQVRRRRYALGWSESILAAKLQIAGFDISRSSVSKIEARLSYVDGQGISLFGGSAKSTGTRTLSDPTTWQSNLRFHRETRDDAILTRRFLLRRNGRGPTPQKSVTIAWCVLRRKCVSHWRTEVRGGA